MKYKLENGKFVNIPEKDIEYLMNKYKLTKEWAIYAWLVDEEYITDPTVEELEKKAKENKISKGARKMEKIKRKPKEKKVNEVKNLIIRTVYRALVDEFEPKNGVMIRNDEKYIDLTIGDREFTINLVEHRKEKA